MNINKWKNTSFRYYRRNRDVKKDRELQAFVNELSADGTGPDGGNGQVNHTSKKLVECLRYKHSITVKKSIKNLSIERHLELLIQNLLVICQSAANSLSWDIKWTVHATHLLFWIRFSSTISIPKSKIFSKLDLPHLFQKY